MAELDGKNILHYHGVIMLSPRFYRKKLRVSGFHFKLKVVWNMPNWLTYCNKNYKLGDFDKTIAPKKGKIPESILNLKQFPKKYLDSENNKASLTVDMAKLFI